MFFNEISIEALIDLRAHMIRLSTTADITPLQSRNLLTCLAMIDAELCRRCVGEHCLATEPRFVECRYDMKLKTA